MDRESLIPGKTSPALAEAPSAAPATAPHAKRPSLLLAVAEPVVADMVEAVLADAGAELSVSGVEVHRVHDAVRALQEAQLLRPDVVVLDARLPGARLVDVLAALDAAGSTSALVILSSTYGTDVPRGMPGAAIVHLPFDNAAFLGVIGRALATG